MWCNSVSRQRFGDFPTFPGKRPLRFGGTINRINRIPRRNYVRSGSRYAFPPFFACMMILLYFCNRLECVHAFWRNRWRTRIHPFPVATWENAMSYHKKYIWPCCRSPKASSIASTKQTPYHARTSLRIVCPSHDGKAKEIKKRSCASL